MVFRPKASSSLFVANGNGSCLASFAVRGRLFLPRGFAASGFSGLIGSGGRIRENTKAKRNVFHILLLYFSLSCADLLL